MFEIASSEAFISQTEKGNPEKENDLMLSLDHLVGKLELNSGLQTPSSE